MHVLGESATRQCGALRASLCLRQKDTRPVRMEPAKLKTFTRTHISGEDFKSAARFIDAARRYTVATTEYEALMHAAIIAYARPFSGNEQGADPPSDPKIDPALVALGGTDRALHDRIIHMRNKVVAHAESAQNPVALLPIKPDGFIASGFATQSRRWHVVEEQIDLDAFQRIADAMHQRCINHTFEIVLRDLGYSP